MTTFSTSDHADFKEFELSGWEKAAEEYHRLWGHLSAQAIARLLDAAGASEGKKVLDVATEAGYAAAAAARGATVTGVDFSPAQVALARREYPAIEFDDGDMEALPYADGCYDAVVMNFRFSDKGESQALLSRAGFEDLHFEIVPLVWRLASAEQMFQAFDQGAVRATVIQVRGSVLTIRHRFGIDLTR